MDLQILIDRGEALKKEHWKSPVIELWKNDVKAATLAGFGDAMVQVIDRAMWFERAINSEPEAQRMHKDMIAKVQQLLGELLKHGPPGNADIRVGQVMQAIINQVEAVLPNSAGKTQTLRDLQDVLASSAFAPVKTAPLSEVLKRMSKSS